jgi:TRAP-type C4-dicarboxylate transport system permease small subunit
MPFGPLVLTAVLAGVDWGAWDWATTTDRPTVGLIAGLLMAPIAVAFAWSLLRVLFALAQLAVRRATGDVRPARRRRAAAATRPAGQLPFDVEAHDDRLAA